MARKADLVRIGTVRTMIESLGTTGTKTLIESIQEPREVPVRDR